MSLTNIRSQLKTVITNLVSSTQIAIVYDYYEPNVSGYPAVVFDISSNTDSFFTNKENMIKTVFTAYIIVEIPNDGINDAKNKLDIVTDALITELRKESNLTLGGYADWISPAVGARQQTDTPSGQAFVQQLDITVNTTGLVN